MFIEQSIQELAFLRELNIASILFRFTLAVICGGVIGLERSIKNHAAGLRTHILVCIASASVMMTNEYIWHLFGDSVDPSRLAAQVISGIGFLGVGTIIVTGRKQIKGLTTAAGLWASACMGLAIGIALYEVAIIMCIFILIVLEGIMVIDARYLKTNVMITLYLEYDDTFKFSNALTRIKKCGWNVGSIESIKSNRNQQEHSGAMIICVVKIENGSASIQDLMKDVALAEGISFVDNIME